MLLNDHSPKITVFAGKNGKLKSIRHFIILLTPTSLRLSTLSASERGWGISQSELSPYTGLSFQLRPKTKQAFSLRADIEGDNTVKLKA
jgi:hypothetical protein